MTAAVEATDLAKTYPGDVQAVKGISFEVQAGEAFGLLGPNGAGKTTTIGMLNTTVTPTSGRATLGGLDVALDPVGTRAISSVVFQDPGRGPPPHRPPQPHAPPKTVGGPHGRGPGPPRGAVLRRRSH